MTVELCTLEILGGRILTQDTTHSDPSEAVEQPGKGCDKKRLRSPEITRSDSQRNAEESQRPGDQIQSI
jgi:hypothetical protein